MQHRSTVDRPLIPKLQAMMTAHFEQAVPRPSVAGIGLKPKDLIGIPWRVAFALQADGWYLRQDIIWSKPNPMPESVTDRCTKAHEYIFLLSKQRAVLLRCGGDQGAGCRAICTGRLRKRQYRKCGRTKICAIAWMLRGTSKDNKTVGSMKVAATSAASGKSPRQPFSEAHFATFPPALIEPCIKAGCPIGGTVLDPFGGAGTTGLVADRLSRNAILIELNPTYAAMGTDRIVGDAPLFVEVAP